MSQKTGVERQQSRLGRTSQAARSGLDVMLTEAAAGGPPRFLAPGSAIKVGAGLARHPGRVAARTTGLTSELGESSGAAPRSHRLEGIGGSPIRRGAAIGFFAECCRDISRSARRSMA